MPGQTDLAKAFLAQNLILDLRYFSDFENGLYSVRGAIDLFITHKKKYKKHNSKLLAPPRYITNHTINYITY